MLYYGVNLKGAFITDYDSITIQSVLFELGTIPPQNRYTNTKDVSVRQHAVPVMEFNDVTLTKGNNSNKKTKILACHIEHWCFVIHELNSRPTIIIETVLEAH
jgi:hypothetical protein